ncbi:MAG: methyltransferase domain-containing protein [Chloroflexota bacterium]|nr:methyltransferase domain-containing protein [Chloroflexota bacterium]
MNRPRLHLGCGLVHRPGWINLDRYATDGADLQADAILLPFPDGSAEAIEARQLIEHLGYVGTLYGLHEWARVLAPGGTLLVETPDRPATLRAATTGESGDAALPWLFGTEQRGQGHRYLFTASELVRLATQAGFEPVKVQSVTARPDHPTLRLTARRASDTPATRFAIRLHRAFTTTGILHPMDALQYLSALEMICEQASQKSLTANLQSLIELVSLSARYSPRVAACILTCLPDPSAWPAAGLAQARHLVADLEQERFLARLACRWRTLPKLPGTADVAWMLLEREISLYLAARLCPGEGLDDVRDDFDAATADFFSSDLAVDFFCRESLTGLARRMTARGVRAFARGNFEGCAQALEAALGYDPDLLWPRWNLARLYLCQGHRLEALVQYETLQANLPSGLRPAFEREMDAVTGRGKGFDDFIVPLADLRDLLEGAT